ncbi:unnamed protein product, partial [Didymodactylos carnosus]
VTILSEDANEAEDQEKANDVADEEDYNINALAKGHISTHERVQDGVKAFLNTLGSSRMLTSEQEVEVSKMLKAKDPEER